MIGSLEFLISRADPFHLYVVRMGVRLFCFERSGEYMLFLRSNSSVVSQSVELRDSLLN